MSQASPAKPFAPACEQNRDPILAVLRERFRGRGSVFEIGSGTGQHAVHFAAALPQRIWQCSEVAANLPGIRLWLAEAALPNTPEPLELDVRAAQWPLTQADDVFSANTAHIMDWAAVGAMFAGVGRLLSAGGCFCLYGPFLYDGRHTADSNVRFDAMLRQQNPAMGVRDVRELERLAAGCGLRLAEDLAMPADNRTLVWRRA